MTAKEKHLAVVRRLEEPPLCDCRDRAMINPENTLEFVCPNKHEEVQSVCVEMLSYTCSCTIVTLFRCFNGEVSFQGVVVWS